LSFFMHLWAKKSLRHIWLLLLVSFCLYAVYMFSGFDNYINSATGLNEALISQDKVINTTDTRILNTYNFSNNSLLRYFYPTNIFERILFSPIRFIGYLLTPFPNLGGFKNISMDFIADVSSTALYLALFPLCLNALRYLFENNKLYFLVLSCMLLSVVFVISFGNLIIVGRYRIMAEPLFIAISSFSLIIRPFNYKILIYYSLGLLFLLSIYYVLKYWLIPISIVSSLSS